MKNQNNFIDYCENAYYNKENKGIIYPKGKNNRLKTQINGLPL